jgi:guanylate kinase
MDKIIISGPSGSGKDTLIDAWMKINPRVKKVITATTRTPRYNEIDGVHYHFYTKSEMQERIDNGEFLEHMNVFGHIYGTPKSSVQQIVDDGDIAIIRIDFQGAMEIRPKLTDVRTVFILPPSLEELHLRLQKRGTDSAEKISERMDTAIAEIIASEYYDCQIVNDEINLAVEKLENISKGFLYKNQDLASHCVWLQHDEATHQKINQFLSLGDEMWRLTNILFRTKYQGENVGVIFNERGTLKVVYTDSDKLVRSFSIDYGSRGEMEVVTEFVRHLMEKSSKSVDSL